MPKTQVTKLCQRLKLLQWLKVFLWLKLGSSLFTTKLTSFNNDYNWHQRAPWPRIVQVLWQQSSQPRGGGTGSRTRDPLTHYRKKAMQLGQGVGERSPTGTGEKDICNLDSETDLQLWHEVRDMELGEDGFHSLNKLDWSMIHSGVFMVLFSPYCNHLIIMLSFSSCLWCTCESKRNWS